MPRFDTVVKNGMIIDGTRAPRYRGDIGIKDGRIIEIGKLHAGDAARELDASGLIVAPGFIDLHTHYDAQVFWDPYCSISGWHGVTSVAIGNCGFGFAPVRPELRERQAAIRAALLELDSAKVLPFSPNVILGYSAGSFGGGSNLVANGILQADGSVLQQNRFGNFGDRQDVDAIVFWSLRNLGVGNLALIRLADSNVRSERLRQVEVLDRVGAEVATAYAKARARFAQIATNERAAQDSEKAFQQDVVRARNNLGLPIEVLDSMRLLGRSRYAYLDAIIDYNRAQFELYVALGQPPADFLALPAPAPKAK